MLFKRTLSSSAWSIASRLTSRAVDFITLVILARILIPADFGLVAIGMTLITIVEAVLEVQLFPALLHIKEIKKFHLDTAFTISLLRGLFLASLILGLSWPFSYFYDDNRLLFLVCILSVAPAARGLQSPGMVVYLKDLNFKKNFIVETAGKLISSILAILVGYFYQTYWAIAVNTVGAPLTSVLISYIISPYRPNLSLKAWNEFRDFIGWLSLVQIVGTFSWQSDRLVLGQFYGVASVGRFSMASDLAALPTQSLVAPAMRPVMAAFMDFRHDLQRIKNAYFTTLQLICLVAMPLQVGLSLNSDLIVLAMLGDKWQSSILVLQWIVIDSLVALLLQPMPSLLVTFKKVGLLLRLGLVELALKGLLIFAGVSYFGLFGAVGGRIISSFIMMVVGNVVVFKLLDATPLKEIKKFCPLIFSLLMMSAVIYTLRFFVLGWQVPAVLKLCIIVFGSGFTYLLVTSLLQFQQLIDIYRRFFPNKPAVS
ncbi:lipopolysaccharide biosynthesis protein [Methylobacterium mesophilicum]